MNARNPRSGDVASAASAPVHPSPERASSRLVTASLLAGLALSAAACEVLIGIPDVTLDTTGSTGGVGGGGGTATTGGAPCSVDPCVGNACTPAELANGKDVTDGAGGATGTLISGVTARDGVVHWGIDRMPGGFVVRTAPNGTSTKQPLNNVPRRLVDDGTNVYWTAVYTACLGITPSVVGATPTLLGDCVSTSSDRSPGLALDASRAYWTVAQLEDCAAIKGCCDGEAKSCLLGASKSGGPTTVLTGGRLNISDVVVVGSDLFFAAQHEPDSGSIERCPADAETCSPEVFVATTYEHSPLALATARGFVYWSTPAGIVRRKKVAAPQSAPEDVAQDAYVRTLVADDGGVYFTTVDGKVHQLSHDDPGNPVEIGKGDANYLAIDCANVYWSDGDSLVRRPR